MADGSARWVSALPRVRGGGRGAGGILGDGVGGAAAMGRDGHRTKLGAAMAVRALAESRESREEVGRRVRGIRAARHLHIASVGEVAVMRTSMRATR